MRSVRCLLFVLAVVGVSSPNLFAQSAIGLADGDFAYTGDKGPGYWANLGESNKLCANTPESAQSPVNIVRAAVDPTLEPLRLDLPDIGVTLKNPGYTIVAVPTSGDTFPGTGLSYDGRDYALAQFHFHTLSEHTVFGQHGVMELHAVFATPGEKKERRLAVLGVLYRIGRYNPFLQVLIEAGLPPKSSSPGVEINDLSIARAFTDTSAYFTYNGSLTTPSCEEGLRWIVLQRWEELSTDQFEAFRKILGNNFRPIQPLNGRVVRVTRKRAD